MGVAVAVEGLVLWEVCSPLHVPFPFLSLSLVPVPVPSLVLVPAVFRVPFLVLVPVQYRVPFRARVPEVQEGLWMVPESLIADGMTLGLTVVAAVKAAVDFAARKDHRR